MKTRTVLSIVAATAFAAALLPVGDAAAQKKFIAIGTGGPTGVYFVTGNAICRMVDASEIGFLTAFLASDKAWAITGELIAAGGGVGNAVYY